jgi:transcriptional regulator with XRE-family HTH domain
MAQRPSPYGELVRTRRVEAKRSLRTVADHIGVSHVFLAEVERGIRAPLKPEYEPKLIEIVPTLTAADLARARALTRPLKITLADTPSQYHDVTLAFARRIENRDLSEDTLTNLMKLLKTDDDKE